MSSIIGQEYLNQPCHYITEGRLCARKLMRKWMSVKLVCHGDKMKNINIKEKLHARLTGDNTSLSRL